MPSASRQWLPHQSRHQYSVKMVSIWILFLYILKLLNYKHTFLSDFKHVFNYPFYWICRIHASKKHHGTRKKLFGSGNWSKWWVFNFFAQSKTVWLLTNLSFWFWISLKLTILSHLSRSCINNNHHGTPKKSFWWRRLIKMVRFSSSSSFFFFTQSKIIYFI